MVSAEKLTAEGTLSQPNAASPRNASCCHDLICIWMKYYAVTRHQKHCRSAKNVMSSSLAAFVTTRNVLCQIVASCREILSRQNFDAKFFKNKFDAKFCRGIVVRSWSWAALRQLTTSCAQFCDQLRSPLCLTLLRNCTSPYDEAYSAAARLFTAVLLQPKLR